MAVTMVFDARGPSAERRPTAVIFTDSVGRGLGSALSGAFEKKTAQAPGLSVKTLHNHRQAIYRRRDVHKPGQLINLVRQGQIATSQGAAGDSGAERA
jgi:hypothetical protein